MNLTRHAARAMALVGVAAVVVYPARALMVLEPVPLAVRLCWPVAALAGLVAPHVSVLAFIAFSPLLHVLPSIYGWPRVSLAELWLLALLAATWMRLAAGWLPARRPLPGAATLFVGVATASVLVTLYLLHLADGMRVLVASVNQFVGRDLIVVTSQRHIYASILAWVVLVEGVAALWLVTAVAGPERRKWGAQLLTAAATGCVCVSLYGVVQWWTGWRLLPFWVEQDPDITRINATFSDVNGLGSYLALMLWIVVAVRQSSARPAVRWASYVAATAVALAILFTASRAAWIAAAAGAVLYVFGLKRFGLLQERAWLTRNFGRLAVGGLAAVALLSVVLATYATVRGVRHSGQRTYLDTLLYSVNLSTPLGERLKGRLELWDAAVRMTAARPVFGIGIGRYYKDVWAYARRQEALILPQENAHNYFLQVAAELGLTGLACLLALLSSALAASWRIGTGGEVPSVRRLALAAGVGIVAFSLTSLTGHPLLLREGQYALWPVVGALLVMWRNAEPAAVSPVPAKRLNTGYGRIAVWICFAGIVATVPARALREAAHVDLSRVPFGLSDREVDRDGQTYRWSSGHVVIHVPTEASTFTITLRSLAPYRQTARVRLDGVSADAVVFDDHNWRTLRYVLPRRSDRRFYRVEVDVDPTWQPPWEDRVLGLMVADYSWTR